MLEQFDNSLPNDRQVWVTAFWGFRPQGSGYISFTEEVDRDRFFEKSRDGDLVLIYGAASEFAKPSDRRVVLGLLEIRKRKLRDIEKMSEEHRQWKHDMGYTKRWMYGVDVSRAWEVVQKIRINNITKTNINVAKRGVILEGQERETVLSLSVRPLNVWGEEPVQEHIPVNIRDIFKKPKGLPPTFGQFSMERTDGVHFLYMLVASGPVAMILGMSEAELKGRQLIKVGYSKNPEKRCKAFNDALPKAFKFQWTLSQQSFKFEDGMTARLAEKAVHARLMEVAEYQGGEFFLGHEVEMLKEFYFGAGKSPIVGRAVR